MNRLESLLDGMDESYLRMLYKQHKENLALLEGSIEEIKKVLQAMESEMQKQGFEIE